MQRLSLAAGISVVAAAGIGLALYFGLRGAAPPTHGSSGPFEQLAYTYEAGGKPVNGIGKSGVMVLFEPRARFDIGVVIRNRSSTAVTVSNVHAPGPSGLVRQVGTRLMELSRPSCGSNSGSGPGPPFSLGCPGAQAGPNLLDYGERLAPRTVAPGGELAVQLQYGLAGCGAARSAPPPSAQTMTIDYRESDSPLRYQKLRFAAGSISLFIPAQSKCLPQPRSEISMSGILPSRNPHRFLEARGDFVVLGSSGDVCMRLRRALLFRSRLFQLLDEPAVRVEIRLSVFRGVGRYRTLPTKEHVQGPAAAFVTGKRLRYVAEHSIVDVRRRSISRLAGDVRATFRGVHAPFRVYGSWRCRLVR